MAWRYDYAGFGGDDDRQFVTHGLPEELIAAVEEKAAELARAASALYGDGTAFTEPNPKGGTLRVTGGMFVYQTIVRDECVYILRIIPWPL